MAAATGELFLDFGIILLVAGAVALLFYYLKQPVVLGYLVAGFLVGPFSWGPSFINDVEVMAFFGELGIVFLLFALGLEFNLRKVRKVGAVAMVAGTLEIAIMLGLGYGIGRMLGWSELQSIFLGAIMSISSTTIIVKVLSEMGQKDEEWAQTALGILIIEDIAAVLILTALSSAGATGNFAPGELIPLLYKLGVFLGAALLLGLIFAPRLIDRLAIVKVEEVMVVLSVGLGFGMAILAGYLGFSPGLGAFIGGALMAESPRVARIEHKIHPLRDVFTAIFFVTVGAALDPASLVAYWPAILLVTAGVVGGKFFAVSLGTFITGAPAGKAIRVGATLSQIGEFAFIIAVLGVGIGAADPALYAIAIAVSAITAFLTPYLIRGSPQLVTTLDRRLPAGIRAYATTYGTWVSRLRRSDAASPERRRIRTNLLTLVLNATVIIAIFATGATFAPTIRGWIASRGVNAPGLEWLVVSAALTPFVYLGVREARAIIVDLARLAVPARLRRDHVTSAEYLLRRTFGLAAIVLAAFLAILIGGLFVDNILFVLLIAGLGIAVGSAVLGRSLRIFHTQVEATIDRLSGAHSSHHLSREEAMHMIDHSHAWGAGSREIRVPAVGGGAGRTIGALRLRELTGASVVSVYRAGEETIAAPGPATTLASDDLVVLIGDDLALTRAEEILLGRDLGVEGGVTEIVVGPTAAGRALGEIGLAPRAEVLGIRRGRTRLPAGPDSMLEAGDILVLIGSDEEISDARAKLG